MAMFENFPYTDMHNLNLDWIIKIAKDFLDQYTSLQQMISDGEQSLQDLTSDGLQQLQEKADNLEALLQAWYDTHSQDIANQLADALADLNAWYNTHQNFLDEYLQDAITAFGTAADAKAAETIASIPSDYTEVATGVEQLKTAISVHSNTIKLSNMVTKNNTYIDKTDGTEVSYANWSATGFVPLPEDCFLISPIVPGGGGSEDYNAFYDVNKTFISKFYINARQYVPANAKYIRCSINTDQYTNVVLKIYTLNELVENIKNSIVFQGSLADIVKESNESITVTLAHNANNNMGYFQLPVGNELYFNGRNGTQVAEKVYTFNIPKYNALVLDISDLYSTNAILQCKVVTYANIKPYHIILVRNCLDNTGLKIDGILYLTTFLKAAGSNRVENKDIVMRSICRMADAYGLPETADAIEGAYNAGFNYIRVNLQFTSDGVPVLWHDPYINQYYNNVYDDNGDLVPYSVADRIKISESTLASLNQYHYGSPTAPAGIPLASSALKRARKIGAKLYFELKQSMTTGNINSLLINLYKYQMVHNVTIISDVFSDIISVSARNPIVRLGLMTENYSTELQNAFNTIKANGNPCMWWGYRSTTITTEIMYFVSPTIDYEVGDFQTYSQVNAYITQTYGWVCKGMEIEGSINPLVGQYLETASV